MESISCNPTSSFGNLFEVVVKKSSGATCFQFHGACVCLIVRSRDGSFSLVAALMVRMYHLVLNLD